MTPAVVFPELEEELEVELLELDELLELVELDELDVELLEVDELDELLLEVEELLLESVPPHPVSAKVTAINTVFIVLVVFIIRSKYVALRICTKYICGP
jgi:hypothetical protein